ncbi:S8 family serine peptidase [Melissospora conviva]|uniref:S8 family serine peptidase n=1 Tax=Melissospora conviva TaxID=3388432 RepID=UPI003C294A6F
MAARNRTLSRYGVALAAAALAITLNPLPASGQPTPPTLSTLRSVDAGDSSAGTYIVTLTDEPLATYEGGVAGIAATKPGKGRKVDVRSADAQRYRSHLKSKHAKVARTVGAEARRSNYVVSNSFVAELTPAQVARLQLAEGVLSITPNRLHKPVDDRNSVDFLGLSGSDGVWSKLGGTADAGKGVVVGVIDTGIWPENPSFAAPPLGTATPTAADPYRPYRQGTTTVMRKSDGGTFTGVCQTGEEFTETSCNEKIISARYFGESWLAAVPPEKRADYVSPRDAQGHGAHTAGTAAGNTGVPVTEQGTNFGEISGVAPGAAIAVYKALWQGGPGAVTGGYTTDLVAAIDQAVADGVDVINYSVGGDGESGPLDATQVAFLNAASAGVFVAAAAGNSGPAASTMDNTQPWQMTVGASTIAPYPASIELGNGSRFTGTSSTVRATLGPNPLITAEAAKAAGATVEDAENCVAGSLDPAKVAGKVVVCLRGVVARPEKSAEVARAGGVGMVLGNPTDQDLSADLHGVPTVHINAPDTQTVLDYAATAGAQVTLLPTGPSLPYPQVAPFSSRGPSLQHRDLLKPDIVAPGVGILAAVAPQGNDGKNFDFYSGTSMAAPHIAGLAALYLAKHPLWSPATVKSAMMTTTYDTKTATGERNTDVFTQGAGHVDPTRMLNPGLVYDTSPQEWLGYLEGLGHQTGSGVAPIQGSDLNYPSIGVGRLSGGKTITRTVTAVTPGVYTAKVDLPGFKTKVTPSTLRFTEAGQSRTFTLTMEIKSAPAGANARTTGSLTWKGAGATVRSPIVVTPQVVDAPVQVKGSGPAGSLSFEVTPMVEKFRIKAYQAVAGPQVSGSVTDQDVLGREFQISVPAGTKALEIISSADDQQAWLAGILFWNGQTDFQVGSQRAAEQRFLVPNPAPGVYTLIVLSLEHPGATEMPFTVQANLVNGEGGVGDLMVSPDKPKVTPGVPLTLTATWSGVPEGVHTGYIEYPNGAGTVVSIN